MDPLEVAILESEVIDRQKCLHYVSCVYNAGFYMLPKPFLPHATQNQKQSRTFVEQYRTKENI